MTVADRIKSRRLELNMTQSELASKIGAKDKSSISKIESKGNDISLRDIRRIADALMISPSYLMGWEDEADFVVSNEEKLVVEAYRESDKRTQDTVKILLRYKEKLDEYFKKTNGTD